MAVSNAARAVRAGSKIATSATKLAGSKINKKIKDEVKEVVKSGARGFEEGFAKGFNKENIQYNSPNEIVNDAIDQHTKNAKIGKDVLDKMELTQNLPEQTKEIAGHAMSATSLLFQGKHHKVAKALGESQGHMAGLLVADSVEIGKVEAEKAKKYVAAAVETGKTQAKQSVADFMKEAHRTANTAYNSPIMSSARKTLGKMR